MNQTFDVDIALVLEGSYPYVKGGVSEWVHKIILGLKDCTFAVIFLGSNPKDYEKRYYDLPKNVKIYKEYYLFSENLNGFNPKKFRFLEKHICLTTFFDEKKEDLKKYFADLDFCFDFSKEEAYKTAFSKRSIWENVIENYTKFSSDPSFIDYFWTIYNLQHPLWKIAEIVAAFPKVKVIHSVSTGYAGFLSALVNNYYKTPFVLTEHGIYTRERRIDLLQSDLARSSELFSHFPMESSYIRGLWIRFFELLSQIAYASSKPILSLFNAARENQIAEGAISDMTRVIPNGIDIEKLKKFRADHKEKVPPVICLLGRVVPIKDVKTFIRSMLYVVQKIPEAEGWIIGPIDENPNYVQECRELISVLCLEDKIKITGTQNISNIFPKIGLLALSSISEGMPLVILESYAAGVPVVTTDVGSCQELINGGSEEDKALGAAGKLVQIANPEALSDAMIELLTNQSKWQKARDVAIKRVEKYYSQDLMFARYRDIYKEVTK